MMTLNLDEHRQGHTLERPPDTGTGDVDAAATPSADLKRLAGEHGVRLKDLLVLAPQNDPFNSGTPRDRTLARWFAADIGSSTTHLRRQHYARVSREDSTLPDGKRYENTDKVWETLIAGGKHARYLQLVHPDRITDQRNPPPHVHAHALEASEPEADLEADSWFLPQIDTSALRDVHLPLPRPTLEGYEYTPARQPRHVEVWCEKTTMNDVLLPVCQRHGVNLTTASGFQSITGSYQLLKRVEQHAKDTVVLYISDFDPAGQHMPRAVARQLEFWSRRLGLEHRVLLQPLVLTADQARWYRLPRVPIKDSDRRKGAFEATFGNGAVELDALEALHPGELARIVEAAILAHRDRDLEAAFARARDEAHRLLDDACDEVATEYQDQVASLEADVERVASEYQAELDTLAERLAVDLRPFETEARRLRQAVIGRMAEWIATVKLPPEPEPHAPPIDPDEYLLDTSRDFMTQLLEYRRRT